MTEPLLSVRGLKTAFKTREGVFNAVDGVSFDVSQGRGAWPCGRVGLRQERHGAVHPPHSPGPARKGGGWRGVLRGARPAQAPRARDAQGARRRHRDGVPGADDIAQPGLHGGRAGGRAADGAQGHGTRTPRSSASRSFSTWSACPSPDGLSPPTLTSSRAGCASG